MKKVMFFALAMLFAVSSVCAQNSKKEGKAMEMMKKRVELLKSELNLSDDQTAKVTELMLSLGKQMKEIRENGEGKSEGNKAKMKALAKERQDKMKLILTPDQLTKLKELNKKEMKDRKAKKEGGEEN